MSAGYTFIGETLGRDLEPIFTAGAVAGLVLLIGAISAKSIKKAVT